LKVEDYLEDVEAVERIMEPREKGAKGSGLL
jgi:hypothetical protein